MTASIDGTVRATDREPVKLWRYYLPNINHEGWSEVVISSGGFFAAVSDYGNYAFAWRSMGCDDARKFFLRAPQEWSYFANKLGSYEEYRQYNGDATEAAIKDVIIHRRREGELSRHEAREQWDLLADFDHLDRKEDFARWFDVQDLGGDIYEHIQTRCAPGLEAFCKVTMGRLAEVIRAELEQEARGAA